VAENGSVETKVFCSLDSFLFDEEDEEKMVAEGQLARYINVACFVLYVT
jgi:hypothetical protein